MAFAPHTCPRSECPQGPRASFVKKGFFKLKRNAQKVRRYQCKHCKKTLSSHTFQETFKQKKPHLNDAIAKLLSEGLPLRGIARILGINYKTVYRKFLWLADHLPETQGLKWSSQKLYFDELETLEHTKLKPLSVGLIVDGSYQILGACVASMPCKGHLASLSRKKYGPRPDERFERLNELFQKTAKKLKFLSSPLEIVTDAKPGYKALVKKHFPDLVHTQVLSRKVEQPDLLKNKKMWDPLFALNQRCAKLRAHIRRLTRRSWCTTKKPENLQRHLDLYIHYNNHVFLTNNCR